MLFKAIQKLFKAIQSYSKLFKSYSWPISDLLTIQSSWSKASLPELRFSSTRSVSLRFASLKRTIFGEALWFNFYLYSSFFL